MRANAWVGLVAGALLVLSRTIHFAPPAQVRVRAQDASGIVGEAPRQEFAESTGSAQTVQLRLTLRSYPDPLAPVGSPDPELDERATVLSQPVVTTILGMNATVEQTVRLEAGDLEVDLSVHATPRERGGGHTEAIELEREVRVVSRRKGWLAKPRTRVHVDDRASLVHVEERGHRLVFTVDEHLFALDLEVHRS